MILSLEIAQRHNIWLTQSILGKALTPLRHVRQTANFYLPSWVVETVAVVLSCRLGVCSVPLECQVVHWLECLIEGSLILLDPDRSLLLATVLACLGLFLVTVQKDR
jgi:hypothetical protein